MGFAINVRATPSLKNWEDADEYFRNTKKPRTARWDENARPLRDTRSKHLSIVSTFANGQPCYDLCLYNTALIRYYKPNDLGERAVHIQEHWSVSSHSFLYWNGWFNCINIPHDGGEYFRLPLSGETGLATHIWGEPFTVRLVLDAKGAVIRSRSAYIPVFRRSSSATMRARRKALKLKTQMMLDMVEMQYADIIDSVEIDPNCSPFESNGHAMGRGGARAALARMIDNEEPTPEQLTTLMHHINAQAKLIAKGLACKRAQAALDYTYWTRNELKDKFVMNGKIHEQPAELRKAVEITQEDLRASLTAYILNLAVLNADERKPYPLFAEALPRSVWSSRISENMHGRVREFLGGDIYDKLVSRKGKVYEA